MQHASAGPFIAETELRVASQSIGHFKRSRAILFYKHQSKLARDSGVIIGANFPCPHVDAWPSRWFIKDPKNVAGELVNAQILPVRQLSNGSFLPHGLLNWSSLLFSSEKLMETNAFASQLINAAEVTFEGDLATHATIFVFTASEEVVKLYAALRKIP